MPTPHFHDLPDGSSIVNNIEEDFWIGIDDMDEMSFSAGPTPALPPPPLNLGSPPPNPVGYSSEFPPHPSYADGSAPLMPPPPSPPPVNFEITENPFISPAPAPAQSHVNGSCNTSIGAEAMAHNLAGAHTTRINPAWAAAPYEMDGTPVRRPRVEDLTERRPAPRTAAEILREAAECFPTTIDTSPQVCDPSPLAPQTPRTSRARRAARRGFRDPDAAIRKDPNAWSLREAVELCKLLEVVLPEAGFHIALTGGLLYKEGRRKDCDLMFYQIRQVEPNYEVLWKYLTVAGVIRSPSYPENGWLVKATYRGKAIDCLFPNAKKAKKVTVGEMSTKQNAYQTSPPTPPTPDMEPPMTATEVAAFQHAERLVRHNDGAPILYRRSPSASLPYDPAELDRFVAASRAVESAASTFAASAPAPCQCPVCRLAVCAGCSDPRLPEEELPF